MASSGRSAGPVAVAAAGAGGGRAGRGWGRCPGPHCTSWRRRRRRRRAPRRRTGRRRRRRPSSTCRRRVGHDHLVARGVRVADAGDVDAEQLEPGRQVGAGEGRRRRRRGGRRRPRPWRSPGRRGRRPGPSWQATSPMANTSGRRGGAAVVDHDAAALADREAGGRGRARRGAGCPAANTTRSASRSARPRRRPARRPDRRGWCAPRPRRRPVRTSMPRSSTWRRSARPPPSSSCTAISRGANSTTVVSQAEQAQGVGRLQAEQAAADHDAGAARRRPSARMASRSSIVRYTNAPAASVPVDGRDERAPTRWPARRRRR